MDQLPEVAAEPQTPAWQTFVAAAAIVLAGVAAYSNSFAGPFVFDDIPSIRDNLSLRQLWPLWPVLVPADSPTVVGRPILNLSLALNYAWGKLSVRSYHVVNLAIHLVAALAFFGVLQCTLKLRSIPARIRADATGLAFASALIWMLHPLQTESVTYIVQRAESLVGVFYFTMLYCVIRGAASARSWVWYSAATVACLIGMATKEVMATAPVMIAVYDRVFLCDSWREVLRRRGKLYAAFATTLVLLVALMVASGGRTSTAGFGYGMSSWNYAMTQFGAIVGYLRLCFWPHPLILDYGIRIARTPAEIVPSAALVSGLVIATFVALWYWPRLGFLGLWFFAILAPTSSIVPLVTQTIAEHRMYLPLAAVVVLTVISIHFAWQSCWKLTAGNAIGSDFGLRSGMVLALLLALAGILAVQTYIRNKDYRSTLALWEDCVRKAPDNHRLHFAVGLELMLQGETRQALEKFNWSLKLEPHSSFAYLNRGTAHFLLKEYDLALADYQRSIDLGTPEKYRAYHNRGLIFEELGQDQNALESFQMSLKSNPRHALSAAACGRLHKKLGNYIRAVADFTRVIELTPTAAEAFNDRGHCQKLMGRLDRAIADYNEAIRLQPDFVSALNNRGVAYAEIQQNAKAVADFTRVIEIVPEFGLAYKNRAISHFDLGEFDRAWADVHSFESSGGQMNAEFLQMLSSASGKSE